ncbi:MAG: type II secretion system protein GspL [Mariprofundaceae bacterium]
MRDLTVSFDGRNWAALDDAGNSLPLTAPEDGWLPLLPDGAQVNTLILPLECLLVRSFSLPLPHPRFIDAGVLAQELDERAGEDADGWWLAWQAARIEADGVAGMVFGMPESWRQAIAEDARWQNVRSVLVDGWARLQMHTDGLPRDGETGEPVAVVDADAEGVFLGVWQPGAGSDGVWRGMRRLNRGVADIEDLADQCLRSLTAMGWSATSHPALGRIEKELLQALQPDTWQGDVVETVAELPGRSQVYVSGGPRPALNFRHGRWAASSNSDWLAMWRRPLAMAAAILVIWLLGSIYQIHALSVQADSYRQQITDAFHQGLPDEPVMIDALAQLRRAAGGSATGNDSLALWLKQLAAIHRVYQKTPWDMQELEWRQGRLTLSGKAANLERLNQIREALQQQSGREVKLADTDLSGDKVSFRMHWQ